ncbi:uncharacterized protein PpBr36_10227 [Pyricularia pennisetigena]|uniref:uncharacterized protein n=1 Tax=Pyricularia pennisetigena TaxID=1578925 RepID=UPI00115381D3|nr:uncharacterized protein PpBr36_10227 [Pyricularia pennisetigena]TLS21361.1 hypothetical protein PpBr36_10227 [Pyricularia pennisetigena]
MLLAFVVFVLICARFYLKLIIQRKRLEASDYLILLSWVCAIGGSSGDIFLLHIRVPSETLATFANYTPSSPESFVFILKYLLAAVFPLYTSFYLCKFAILAVYLQLFPRHMREKRYALYATIGYNVAALVASILTLILSCLPVERNWSLDPADACPDRLAVSDALWVLHISSSLMETNHEAVYILPFLILKGMQLRKPVKVGLYFTFGLSGIDLVVSSVMRFVWFRSDPDNLIMSTIDLYYATDNYIFLIIACLPPLRPYLGNLHSSESSGPSWRRSKSSSNGSSSSGDKGHNALPRQTKLSWRTSQLSPISPTAAAARLGSTDTLDDHGMELHSIAV